MQICNSFNRKKNRVLFCAKLLCSRMIFLEVVYSIQWTDGPVKPLIALSLVSETAFPYTFWTKFLEIIL